MELNQLYRWMVLGSPILQRKSSGISSLSKGEFLFDGSQWVERPPCWTPHVHPSAGWGFNHSIGRTHWNEGVRSHKILPMFLKSIISSFPTWNRLFWWGAQHIWGILGTLIKGSYIVSGPWRGRIGIWQTPYSQLSVRSSWYYWPAP